MALVEEDEVELVEVEVDPLPLVEVEVEAEVEEEEAVLPLVVAEVVGEEVFGEVVLLAVVGVQVEVEVDVVDFNHSIYIIQKKYNRNFFFENDPFINSNVASASSSLPLKLTPTGL